MRRLFVISAISLMALVSCDSFRASSAGSVATEVDSLKSYDIAFVSVEAVLAQSDIYTTEGAALQAKTEKAQSGWMKREQGLQQEFNQLQEKYQKGLITTANAQKEQTSIESRAHTFQQNRQKEAQNLEEESRVFANRTQELMRQAVAKINEDGQYKMIINASALIDADQSLDITEQVLEAVNALYAAEKKKK